MGEGGVICTLNSDFTNTFWATGIMNHENKLTEPVYQEIC